MNLVFGLPGSIMLTSMMFEWHASQISIRGCFAQHILMFALFLHAPLTMLPICAALQWFMVFLTFRYYCSPTRLPPFPLTWTNGRGKTALLTGVNFNGIGYEICRSLLALGYTVVAVDIHDECHMATVIASLTQDSAGEMSYIRADLTSFQDITKLVQIFRNRHSSLELLINNAGGSIPGKTAQGFPKTFMLCYLAPYVLTMALLDLLKQAPDGRIIYTCSSSANMIELLSLKPFRVSHIKAGANEADDNDFFHYARAKLCIALLTKSLQSRLDNAALHNGEECKRSNVTVNCFHPGAVGSNIWMAGKRFMGPFFHPFNAFVKGCLRTPQGTLHLLFDHIMKLDY
jgi:NAD(P)-dependent dehydrogenase (short-subunit alcohol dehydrogenase family)